MVVLTEEMVIARTKQSNLATITKLNCWGSQLSDVSLLRRMPNVTVLSLSVNGISSLADFQYCTKLQDLFVRKNNIRDLNQVCYLQDLQHLKSLWLDENPCAVNEGYRMAVLRALPQLSKLDNTGVEPTELEQAKRFGRPLIHPEQQDEYYSDPEEIEDERKYPQYEEPIDKMAVSGSSQYVEQEPENYSPEPQYSRSREYVQNISNHEIEGEVHVDDLKPSDEQLDSETVNKLSANKEEPLDTQVAASMTRASYSAIPRSRTADGELGCSNDWRRARGCQGTCNRRPSERRPNVLNAVLCLIKELDYSNLEVVEMAVRSRMDELEG